MPLAALIPALFGGENNPISKLIGLIPDPNEKRRMEQELQQHFMQAVAQLDLAQLEINKAEAASGSLFIGGWRPFIGWVCGVAIAWTFVVQPMATFALSYTRLAGTVLPALDVGTLMQLVLAMLGMSGLRTFEKFHGVSEAPSTPKRVREIFKRRKKEAK